MAKTPEKKVMIKKKWRWYNKLWLYLTDPFMIDVDYSVELRKRLSRCRFVRKQFFVLFVLAIPVFFIFFASLYCSKNAFQNEFLKINMFDIVATISTYVGTNVLALVVWHNSWVQKREKENEAAIRVHAEIEFNNETNSALFIQDDITNIRVVFTNQNSQLPISVKYVRAFRLDKTVVNPVSGPATITYKHQNESKLLDDSARLLNFNETETISVGFKSGTITLPTRLYLVFRISNSFGHNVCCIVNCTLDKSGFCSDMLQEVRLVDVSLFKKFQAKFGYNFIKEIVWYSPAGWQKKWINRIHMFKTTKIQEKQKSATEEDSSKTE